MKDFPRSTEAKEPWGVAPDITSECFMFLPPDVVIPESPEAYIKLTKDTLKSSSGRKQESMP